MVGVCWAGDGRLVGRGWAGGEQEIGGCWADGGRETAGWWVGDARVMGGCWGEGVACTIPGRRLMETCPPQTPLQIPLQTPL